MKNFSIGLVLIIATQLSGCISKLEEDPNKIHPETKIGKLIGEMSFSEENFSSKVSIFKDYKLELSVEEEDSSYYLIAKIYLQNKCYIASPFTVADLSGKFDINLDSNDFIQLKKSYTEIPPSVEEFDHRENIKINRARTNTMYILELEVNSLNDYEINGEVKFVLEPKCTMEKHPFIIESKNGKLNLIRIVD